MIRWHIVSGLLFSVVIIGFVGLIGDWSKSPVFGISICMACVLPILSALVVGVLFRRSRAALITCLVGLYAAMGFMVFLYVYAFHINPDPQGGLILLFGPIYTMIGLLPFGLVAVVLFLRHSLRR